MATSIGTRPTSNSRKEICSILHKIPSSITRSGQSTSLPTKTEDLVYGTLNGVLQSYEENATKKVLPPQTNNKRSQERGDGKTPPFTRQLHPTDRDITKGDQNSHTCIRNPGRDYDDRRISNLKIYNIIKKSNMSKITKRLEELRVRSEKHNRDLMDIASEVYEKHLNTHSEICDNLNKLESYTDQHDPFTAKVDRLIRCDHKRCVWSLRTFL